MKKPNLPLFCQLTLFTLLAHVATAATIADAVGRWTMENNANSGTGTIADFSSNNGFATGTDVSSELSGVEHSNGIASSEGASGFGEIALGTSHPLLISGDVSVFARVKMSTFAGRDDIVRVGQGSYSGLDYYGLEFNNGQAEFHITGDNQAFYNTPATGQANHYETVVTHGSTLSTDVWYDIVGVYNADPTTSTMSISVYESVSGNQVGTAVQANAVYNPTTIGGLAGQNIGALETLFLNDAGFPGFLLFSQAPFDDNGHNNGQLLEQVAIWDQALSPTEIRALTVPEPSASLLLGLGSLALILRRRK